MTIFSERLGWAETVNCNEQLTRLRMSPSLRARHCLAWTYCVYGALAFVAHFAHFISPRKEVYMDFVDRDYLGRLAPRLERFRERGTDYNFRCPFCGDSARSEEKARGWVRWSERDRRYSYSCYNCSCSHSIAALIARVDPSLSTAYTAARFKSKSSRDISEDRSIRAALTAKPVFARHDSVLAEAIPVASEALSGRTTTPRFRPFPGLKPVWGSEWALEYLASRHIPVQALDEMFVADPLTEVSGRIPAYEHLRFHKMKGIVFPYYGSDGSIAYLQARTTSADLRYMTFEVGGGGKLWGRHRIKRGERAFMFEGVLDAVMTPNGLASGGVDLIRAAKIVKEEYPDTPVALVYDSDWHSNEQVYWQVKRAIEEGFDVVFANGPGKDVNAMVMAGWTVEAVNDMLHSNIKTGLSARLAFAEAKKPWGRKKLAAIPSTTFRDFKPRL